MAKKKTGIAARSDIPYLQRMQMERVAQIKHHRDDAARIALQVACVALNDTEGLGYLRLSRFAKRLQQLIREYYEDPEVGAAHLETRLRQMGFLVRDGRMLCAETEQGEIVPTRLLEEQDVGGV